DLQDAGLLSGQRWIAFDLTAHVDPNSWWVSIITGVTELAPKMTVLQVVAWAVYLAVVIPLFVQAGRKPVPKPVPAPAAQAAAGPEHLPQWERLVGRRPWAVAGVLVVAPVAAAGIAVAALPAPSNSGTTAVSITSTGCAQDWTTARTGAQNITVDNQTSKAGEINLDNAAGAVVAELETIGPATTADMSATLGPGSYTFKCHMSGQAVTTSATVQAAGRSTQTTTAAVKPVTLAELTGPNQQYERYAAGGLTALAGQVSKIKSDLGRGDLNAARTDWLAAQLDWEKVGASYDSFGDLGTAVDGLPDGLPSGVTDKDFTGLHRLEYGLWHGQSAATLEPVIVTLAANISTIQKNLTSDDLAGDPANLPIRAHEILEDALRDHLSGIDGEGSGDAYAATYADVQADRTVLGELAPLIQTRAPKLLPTAYSQLNTLQKTLLATRSNGQWTSISSASLAQRQQVDGAIGAALETLSSVPDLLEVPPTH
ncbi:MAG TPA: EfeM/EfeO family lipoprotein, partial [Streptosporangiaceae bacterium]|nr:EfeM/EfeO family lipoprotein [Streptosporangiaceae bacterium]